jgi:hypothetical protein
MSKDIVINCPSAIHKNPPYKLDREGKRVETIPVPKILFIASQSSIGKFKIQCCDHRCRKTSGHKGWFEIILNGMGGYEVKALPLQRFDIRRVPYVVSEG